MMIVIGILTSHWPTMAWYSTSSGSTNNTTPIRIKRIGRSRSVAGTASPPLPRSAPKPLRIPENKD